ncbi:MAG: hypothetical protein IK077_16540 [Thermoguttaceae bacterium]|nr:hypothetical protein [Thermoguttaceae bacterium]
MSSLFPVVSMIGVSTFERFGASFRLAGMFQALTVRHDRRVDGRASLAREKAAEDTRF